MDKSHLHDQVKDLLRMNLGAAKEILALHDPDLLKTLQASSDRILGLPETDPLALPLKRAFNAYLTYSRAIVWNDTLRSVAEHNEEMTGHAS